MSESGNKVFDWIKNHPWETGGVIFVVGAAVLYFAGSSGSGSAAASGTNDGSATAAGIAAASQLQAEQINAGVQNSAIQASQSVQNAQTAASVSIATLQAQTAQNNDTLASQTAQVIANLQATVANTQTKASVTINQQNDAALQAIALAPYQVELARINAAPSAAQLAALQTQLDLDTKALQNLHYFDPGTQHNTFALGQNGQTNYYG